MPATHRYDSSSPGCGPLCPWLYARADNMIGVGLIGLLTYALMYGDKPDDVEAF